MGRGLCSGVACSFWSLVPCWMDLILGCLSTLALAVTKARALHKTSSVWMRMTDCF